MSTGFVIGAAIFLFLVGGFIAYLLRLNRRAKRSRARWTPPNCVGGVTIEAIVASFVYQVAFSAL